MRTHDVDPCPPCDDILAWIARHQSCHAPNTYNTADEDAHDGSANSFAPSASILEAPEPREILRHRDDTAYRGVGGKSDIVELHRRGEPVVALRILSSDFRRVEESGIGNEVGSEAKDVDRREVDGGPASAATVVVEQRLRVERERPGDKIGPAKDIGQNREKQGGGHDYMAAGRDC